jgi:AraC-like DNA-binding protein
MAAEASACENGAMAGSGQVNEAVARTPAEPLRPFIAHYSGYRQAGIAPAEHRGLPSPFLTVIFTLHEPLTIAEHPDPHQPPSEYRTLVGGLHTSPALVTHGGSQSGIQVGLSPLGARALLGVPAGELAIIDVDGSDVLGPLAGEVRERILEAADWPDRFAVLDGLLSQRLRRVREQGISPEVEYSWRRLLATGGAMPISALVAETGWSDRHLRNAFGSEIGLTPKAAARVIRFHRARLTLQRRAAAGRGLDLAGLAVGCGYYDQAHMDLEFRALAGSAPTTWLAREFRNFQAAAHVSAEGLLV